MTKKTPCTRTPPKVGRARRRTFVNVEQDYSRFTMHLNRYQIDRVCHYTHWIPNLRGFTSKFFAEHHPGWDLPTFMRIFRAADILLEGGIGSPLAGRCHWKLKTLHFSRDEEFAIEWDGSITADDGKYFWSGEPDATGNAAFSGSVAHLDLADDEVVHTVADRIIRELGLGDEGVGRA